VDQAFSQFHTDLVRLRELDKGDAARATVENADKLLKQLRQGAVKAIHAATTCFKHDEDKAGKKDDDEDDEDQTPSASPSPAPSAPGTAATGITATDAKTIADQAVAAMKLVFDTAKAHLPVTTASPKPSHSPRPSFTADPDRGNKHDGKGRDDD
jgi:hypothetical protein